MVCGVNSRRIPLVSRLAVLLTIGGLLSTAQTVAPQVSSSSLTFTAVADGPSPPTQLLSVITPDGSPFTFAVLADSGAPGSDAPGWLLLARSVLSVPAQIRVSVDQTGLPPGSYAARIQLTDTQGRALGIVIGVTLNVVQGAARPAVSPARVSIATTVAAGTVDEGILVRNLGAGSLAPVTVSVASGASWLTALVDSCDTVCVVRARAFVGGITPGAYFGIIRINTAIGSQEIPVSLFLSDHGPLIQPAADELQFEVTQGSGFIDARTISVSNAGDMQAIWSADVLDGRGWLSISPPSGSTAAGTAAVLTVSSNAGNMAAGTYGGLIRFNLPGASNAAFYLPVILRVNGSGAPATPILSSGGVVLTPQSLIGAGPIQIGLSASSATPVPFQASIQGARWLSVTPPRGQVASLQTAQLTLGADANNLAAGFYSGLINVSFGNTNIRTLNVGFVPPSPDACGPQNLHLIETGTPDNFTARAGFPLTLEATIIDDCGNPVTNAFVFVTFSNGDPGLGLTVTAGGRYAGTWTPVNSSLAGGSTSVTFRAFAPNLKPASYELIGTINSDSVPMIQPGGVVNNFFPQSGAPIAPGTAIQIFGSAFGKGTAQGTLIGGRLSTNLQGVTVKIGGIDAPLYYSSGGQINAMAPLELQPHRQHQVIVNVNGVYSKPEPINVAPARPGIATFPDNNVIAQDANYNLVTAQNPAHRGDMIILYLTGMGVTVPPVATGAPAPRSPLAEVMLKPQVTIDGTPAQVVFAGLSPDSVGLYQINVVIPPGAKAGDLTVVVTQNSVSANTALIPVR